MNKQDLINRVSELTGDTKRAAENAVNAVIDAVTEAVSRGDRIEVKGLMTVRVTDRPARTGRNPINGEAVEIPARRAVTIKPAAALKAAANKE